MSDWDILLTFEQAVSAWDPETDDGLSVKALFFALIAYLREKEKQNESR